MDVLPSGNIFRELQDIHDTGYFSPQSSIEELYQQVSGFIVFLNFIFYYLLFNGHRRAAGYTWNVDEFQKNIFDTAKCSTFSHK